MSAAETQDGVAGALPARAKSSTRMWEIDFIGRTWRFFTSVRLALVLILMLAVAVEPYYNNPVPGAIFMELDLRGQAPSKEPS